MIQLSWHVQEDEGDPSSLPNLGTALPVVLFMLHQPVLLPAVGSWMRLRNVYCCVIAGQLQARSSIVIAPLRIVLLGCCGTRMFLTLCASLCVLSWIVI